MIRRTIDHFDGLKEKLESLLASSGLDGPPQVLPTTYGEGETRLALPTQHNRTTIIQELAEAVERSAYTQQGARAELNLSFFSLTPDEFGFLLTEAEVIHDFDTLSETPAEDGSFVQIVGTIGHYHPEDPKPFVVKVWLS